ncbi:MAG: hypothetical protein IH623_07035 [Verrucomicrobia bacterium]|nr:hypothetical protein [Verrucomicrobiota bacterium]
MKRKYDPSRLAPLALCLGLIALRSNAAIWNESGDAGQLLGSAQQVTGSGSLTEINGNIDGGGDRDVFLIRITDPLDFSFTVTATGNDGNNADTILALFNANGIGIVYNDNIDAVNLKSRLDSTVNFVSNAGAGDYYLAIMGGGQQFVDVNAQAIWLEEEPWEVQKGPDGPSTTDIFNGYFGVGGANVGSYTISITGGVTPVPEPAYYGLAFAIMGMAVAGFRYRNSRKAAVNR